MAGEFGGTCEASDAFVRTLLHVEFRVLRGSDGPPMTSWIKDKAHGELARIREAKAKQVYPYFRPFERS